ncbi:MAG: FAD-dependent oxidoreductase, partial [Actinomycetota bacterium]
MQVLTPQPMSMPAAGPATCAQVEGRLKTQDIRFRPLAQTEDVQPGRVTLSGGDTVEAEVLILVPPNRPPPVVRESGLTGDGDWVQVDPSTLATEHQRIYAIGDVVEMQTGAGLPFPKAGVFAERHGEVVARNIAAAVADRAPSEEFEGFGYCFLEVGGGAASMVRGNFLAQPPAIEIGDAAPEHLESKEAFERDRLARWFPG